MKLHWISSRLSKQRLYLWILLAGALAGSAVTLLAWLQKWTPLRAPHWLYAALFWVGVAAVLGVGILLQRRHRFLSRLWVLLSVVAAIGLVWLFPETLAPGCGGMPRAFAHWENHCTTTCTTVCTWWVPLSNPTCAAEPHMPWDIGCCWAYGDSCTTSCNNVWVDDPPSVSGSVSCATPGSGGWCRGGASLNLTTSDPQGYPTTINGSMGGTGFSCSGSCSQALPQGAGSASFSAVASGGGNLSSTSGSAIYQVDSAAPSLAIAIPAPDGANGWFTSSPVTATASATDTTSGVASVTLNGGGTTFTASLDGAYSLAASATDNAGNTATTSAMIKIDSIPPALSVSASPSDGDGGWYVSPVIVSAISSDATSGVSRVQVRVDGGAWQEGSTVTVDTDGTHTVEFQAWDQAGNHASASPLTVQVDRTPPIAAAGLTTPDGLNGWYVSPVTIQANSSDTVSGLASQGISLDGLSWVPSILISTEGTTTVQVHAQDNAGNTALSSQTIRVDTTAPSVSLLLPAADGNNGWYVSPLTVSASGSDATSGVESQQVSSDGITWSAGLTLSQDGVYTVQGRVTDNAGNSAVSSATVHVDTNAPSVSVLLPLADGENGWYVSPVTFTASGSDATSGVASQLVSLDGNTWSACLTLFQDGVYTVQGRVTDNAGNTSPSSVTVHVDATAPSASILLPPADGENGWYVSPVTITASGSDATSGVGSQMVSLDGSTWSSSLFLTQDGIYTVQGHVTDNAGNTTTASQTVQIDHTQPSLSEPALTGTPGQAGWYTSSVGVSVDATDLTSGMANLLYSVDGGSWLPGPLVLTDGRHTVQVQATDRAGNVSTESQLVDVDSTPPQSGFISPAEGSVAFAHGREFVMSGQSADVTSGLDEALISLDGGSTWQPLAASPDGSWSYTWDTTTVANGPHVVLVSAGDLAGNQEHTARITVIVANLGPAVSITELFWIYQQAEVGFSAGILPITGARIVVSDGGEHSRTFSYSASSLPSSFHWDGVWNDGSQAGPGSYQVEVSAWDMFGNDAHAVGTVQIPYPRPTPTVISSPQGTPTLTPMPTATPTTPPAATPSRPPATPVPPAPVLAETPKPETPVQRPPLLWPLAGFVALLAALATASLSDSRPHALDALGKVLEDLNLPGEHP